MAILKQVLTTSPEKALRQAERQRYEQEVRRHIEVDLRHFLAYSY